MNTWAVLQKLQNIIWYQSLYRHTSNLMAFSTSTSSSSSSFLLLFLLPPPPMVTLQPLPPCILYITTFKSSFLGKIIPYGTPKLSHTLRAMSYMNLSTGNPYVLPNSLTSSPLNLLHQSWSKIQSTKPGIIKTK